MSLVKQITAAVWPTSGTATSGTTGLDTLTADSTQWTHVGSSDVPTGSLANGYIQLPTGEGGELRVDDAITPFTSSDDYWVRLWLYAERDGTLGADQTSWFPHSVVDTGTKLRAQGYLRNTTVNPGFTISVFEFLAGGTKQSLLGLGSSGGSPVIPLDTWFELALHVRRHASDGRYGLYVNGTWISEISGVDTQAGIEADDLAKDWFIDVAGIAGVRWRVSGPIESWEGTDITLRPNHGLVPANSNLRQHLMHMPVDTVYTQGRFFALSGTAALDPVSYSSGGINPQRLRVVASGSPGDTATIETIDSVGALPYNRYGWATVMLTDFYLPGSPGDFTLVLRNGADSADVLALTITGGNLMQGSTTLAAFDGTLRYALGVHLRDTGEATWSLIDLTSPFTSTQTFHSGPLSSWSPQTIGKVRVSATLGSAAVEVGALDVCEWCETVAVDSLAHAEANGVTPAMAAANHVAGQFSANRDFEMVPGGPFRLRDQWAAKGHGRRSISVVLARSGGQREHFTANVVAGMASARGMLIWNIDGGSINDVSAGTADDAERDAKVAEMAADVRTMIHTVIPNGNRLVFTTMIRREQGTYNSRDLQEIDLFNSELLAAVYTNQRDGLIELTDVAASINPHSGLFSPGDDIHFDPAGDEQVAIEMVLRLITPGEVTFSSTDRARLDAVFAKLPSSGFLRSTSRDDGAPEDVDGVSDRSLREALLAWIAGESALVDHGGGSKTITYKKQDGTTDKLAITFSATGEFTGTVIS